MVKLAEVGIILIYSIPSIEVLMAHITIQSINLISEQITVLFKQSWFQEDIITLRQLLLDKVPNHLIKEITLGADRENIRFLWLNDEFVLNFDYYSQSCWFSAQDEISRLTIPPLFDLLTKG